MPRPSALQISGVHATTGSARCKAVAFARLLQVGFTLPTQVGFTLPTQVGFTLPTQLQSSCIRATTASGLGVPYPRNSRTRNRYNVGSGYAGSWLVVQANGQTCSLESERFLVRKLKTPPSSARTTTTRVLSTSCAMTGHSRVLTGYSQGTHRALTGYSPGYSRGTHRVLTGYSPGTHGVLTGYSRGTHRALTGYSRGTHGVLTGAAQGPQTRACSPAADAMQAAGSPLSTSAPGLGSARSRIAADLEGDNYPGGFTRQGKRIGTARGTRVVLKRTQGGARILKGYQGVLKCTHYHGVVKCTHYHGVVKG
jgi:hypothetical protein